MISRLHYITQDIPDFSHAELAELACKGGANWIQLRVKKRPFDEWLRIAEETKKICLKYGAKLIINDSVEIAKRIGADGVHLGKEDMSPKEARKIMGKNFIIGGSTNTKEDVKRMIEYKCDYVGIGPFCFTFTKEKLNLILGLNGIKLIADEFKNQIPMIAIGGVKLKDVEPLMQIGVHGVAVSSAINMADDKIAEMKKFIHVLNKSSFGSVGR